MLDLEVDESSIERGIIDRAFSLGPRSSEMRMVSFCGQQMALAQPLPAPLRNEPTARVGFVVFCFFVTFFFGGGGCFVGFRVYDGDDGWPAADGPMPCLGRSILISIRNRSIDGGRLGRPVAASAASAASASSPVPSTPIRLSWQRATSFFRIETNRKWRNMPNDKLSSDYRVLERVPVLLPRRRRRQRLER